MRARRLILLVAVMTVGVGVGTAAAQEAPTTTLRIFDVSALVTSVRDAEIEEFGLTPGLAEVGNVPKEDNEPLAPFQPDELRELIRMSCGAPESWDQEGVEIMSASHGRMIIRQTPEILEQIATYLAWLDGVRRKPIGVEVHWLYFGDRSLERLRSAGLEAALERGSLEDREVALVLAEVAQPGNAHQSGSATSTLGRRVAIRRATYVSYLKDYDVEIAQAAQIGAPRTAIDKEGLEVYVRPRALLDGNSVSLEILARAGEFKLPMPVVQLEATDLGTLDMPCFETANLSMSGVVRSGRTMASVIRNPFGDRAPRLAVLLVTPRLPAREVLRPEPSPEFLDCGFLSSPIRQFVIGWTDRPEERMGVAPGVFLMEDVDQAFELDLLVDLIRMSIEPESWDSDRASLVCSGAGSGWIMAGNTRKITAEARQLVLTAEVQVKRTLRISAQLYSVPTESLSGAGAMLASGPRPDAKVLARIGKLPGARNVTGLTLNAVSGAWVCGQAGLTRNYVLGYDVEVAQESRISDPLIGQVFDGLLVNARPVLSTSGREVKMRIGFRLASVDEASLTEARRTGSEINGVMHHPRERTLRYNGTVTLPLGGCHILDGGADLTEEGRRYVIVLEAR